MTHPTPNDGRAPSPDYTEMDACILRAIAHGDSPLYSRLTRAESERLATESKREAFRVIDGRLQALRKAGRIKADRKKPSNWVVVGAEA